MPETLAKLKTTLHNEDAFYHLRYGAQELPLNEQIGQVLTLQFTGNIFCAACGRKTAKSYHQGHCYPCSQRLASCDLCIVKPERCHFHLGTCREPDWGLQNCFSPHIIYLANTSGLKVGITRESQFPTRWIDQGAIQALPIFKVVSRYQSGLIESTLAKYVADKTNWRTLLKEDAKKIDLVSAAKTLLLKANLELNEITKTFKESCEILSAKPVSIKYPVNQYLKTIKSLAPEKQPTISGTLLGIKGQYLIFDSGVINIRKHIGYEIKNVEVNSIL